MSKGISRKEIREFYKEKYGIHITEDLKKSCAKCSFFDTVSKYCGKHNIKTRINENCSNFKRQKAHKVYLGGSTSPR
ncbi:hypothetical protein [Priestia megaterium]|uniref:hypothetical protein n=1 Tax=Priestia megaterium TaxID=1404 RepID=UPI00234F1CCB|nr:hypothetical protein [Priestia megaterium]MDC7783880.1 hypothetical protein [Priestia megaterium]